MSRFFEWFCVLYAFAGLFYLAYWHPTISAIIFMLVIALAWIIYRENGRKEREMKQRGYHVEYVSPGVLHGDEDEIALVYHGIKGKIWFDGKLVDRKSFVIIPVSDAWDRVVPSWAKEQRTLIAERVQKSRPKVKVVESRNQIIESSRH